MKLRIKLPVVAVAAALTVAGATSALAVEHQFGGAYTLLFDNSNFNPDGVISSNEPTKNFIEQRVRLGYTAKANDNLKLVSMFELDYAYWGNSAYATKRNQGGAIGADSVNLETKNLYLDMNVDAIKTNVKAGMQAFDDSYKGVFAGADMAGLLFTHNYSKATASAGFFRLDDENGLGKNSRDFFLVDAKYELSKSTKVGASYYYVNSDNVDINNDTKFDPTATPVVEDLYVHMLGVNAETTMGNLTLDGFAAYQFGKERNTGIDRSAFAANVGARYKIAKDTLRAEFLYVSGDKDNSSKHSFYTPVDKWQLAESGFYNNEMVILGRDKFAMTNDNAIVYDANNRNQGVIFGSVGYDHPFSDKLAGSVNAGFAAVAKDNGQASGSSDYLGTEVNAELGYKLMDNVTLTARGGYVFLGDYFSSSDDNPYDVKLIARYSF